MFIETGEVIEKLKINIYIYIKNKRAEKHSFYPFVIITM
jgi:hypothetical protein